MSCCDVLNFGIGEGKRERKSLQRRWGKWGSLFPFPKFMTSQQDNMVFFLKTDNKLFDCTTLPCRVVLFCTVMWCQKTIVNLLLDIDTIVNHIQRLNVAKNRTNIFQAVSWTLIPFVFHLSIVLYPARP